MKLSHCHVHITAAIVGADLGTCQTSIMKFFAKNSIVLNMPLHVTNEKLTIDNKQIASLFALTCWV